MYTHAIDKSSMGGLTCILLECFIKFQTVVVTKFIKCNNYK